MKAAFLELLELEEKDIQGSGIVYAAARKGEAAAEQKKEQFFSTIVWDRGDRFFSSPVHVCVRTPVRSDMRASTGWKSSLRGPWTGGCTTCW